MSILGLIDQNKNTSEKKPCNIPVRGARRCWWAGNSVDYDWGLEIARILWPSQNIWTLQVLFQKYFYFGQLTPMTSWFERNSTFFCLHLYCPTAAYKKNVEFLSNHAVIFELIDENKSTFYI